MRESLFKTCLVERHVSLSVSVPLAVDLGTAGAARGHNGEGAVRCGAPAGVGVRRQHAPEHQ